MNAAMPAQQLDTSSTPPAAPHPSPQQTTVGQTASLSDNESSQQPVNGAHVFLQSLVDQGVDTIFGYPGGVILPIYDALPDFPTLKHILVRHEQGATHMAEGYAKATGKVGVVLVTSGPGATNTVTGIADAYYDSVPIVVFTGNVPTTMLGNDAFQEADIVGMTRACTKHNLMVRDVRDMASAVHEAFYVARTGRPGPVLVDLPKDVLNATTAPSEVKPTTIDLPGYQPDAKNQFTDADLQQALEVLASAERPVLLSGGGVILANATESVVAFAERFNIPVGCSLMGLSGFPATHSQYMGYTGMHGRYWANIAIAKADVLLVVGNRLGERQTGNPDRFAKNAKIIHIDVDPTSLQKNVEACIPIQGDIQAVISRLLELTTDMAPFQTSLSSRQAWYDQIESWKQRRVEDQWPDDYLNPVDVVDRIYALMPKDGIVTTEVGQHQMWAAQSFNLTTPRSFITSGGLGTMGFGFPAAIGVQAAYPDRCVIDIAGDGSFQMVLQELATAKDYGLGVKVMILNNSYLGMVRQWQRGIFRHEESHSRMTSPDYVKLAEAFGGVGFVVEHPSQVDETIQKALAITDRPVVVDFRVHERADVYPWVPAGGANEEMLTQSKNKGVVG
jgi:acetolactate synthase-1/2/3 large subunit